MAPQLLLLQCGCSAKRWGKRFRSVLAEIAGQRLGGPPHRASDLFSFSQSFLLTITPPRLRDPSLSGRSYAKTLQVSVPHLTELNRSVKIHE